MHEFLLKCTLKVQYMEVKLYIQARKTIRCGIFKKVHGMIIFISFIF